MSPHPQKKTEKSEEQRTELFNPKESRTLLGDPNGADVAPTNKGTISQSRWPRWERI